MKIKSVTLKCMSRRCGHKEVRAVMPNDQPMCPYCCSPMALTRVSASERADHHFASRNTEPRGAQFYTSADILAMGRTAS